MSLKDMFIPKDDGAKKAEKPTASKTTTTSSPSNTNNNAHAPISIYPKNIEATDASNTVEESPVASGGKKQDFKNYLKKVMEDNNIPGPDYEEFSTALEKMKSKAMDEATRFQTVFMSFEAMGVTTDRLVETANTYKGMLSNEKTNFENGLKNNVAAHVTSREKQINDLIAKNKSIEEQMTALNTEKLNNEQLITKIDQDKSSAAAQLSSQGGDFNAAYNESISEIDKNIELINKYLVTSPAQK